MSQQAVDEFKLRLADPDGYTGPMNSEVFRILKLVANVRDLETLFLQPTVAAKVWTLYSLNFNGTLKAAEDIDYVTSLWANHIITLGAWWWDSRQVGTEWELDGEGILTGNTTGTPTYPIHVSAYKFMPDVVVYDENGDEVSRTPASSNADLRDINVTLGQAPRRFA